jgi:hypothetical protein
MGPKMKKLSASLLLGLTVAAATLLPSGPAEAFCGFYVGGADTKLYNNATQVVLMRDGTRTVLAMQNNYEGPPSGFAMVVPVPVVLQKENVKTLPRELFEKVDQLSAPRLVEYWEQDPCALPQPHYEMALKASQAAPMADESAEREEKHKVKVEARFAVGEYDIVILSARDSNGLEGWLREERYAIPAGAEPFLRPYVEGGSKFFVAKVDPKRVRFDGNQAMLSPLRFHYDAEQFSLPVRLGLMNAKDAQDLIVHVLARGQRYEVANLANVAIPTNFDVKDSVRGNFPAFYTSLFDETLRRHPGAVVTEYAWDATTCDPCPGPALDPEDFMSLGEDVMPSNTRDDDEEAPAPRGWTLTRLHARYSKDTLGADLFFRAAVPIVGGREFVRDPGGKVEQGAHIDQVNNFQGRYVIRHAWTGPIKCENPRRGIWGGPPGGSRYGDPATRPVAAQKLAFAKRGQPLASFVDGPVPEVNYKNGAGPAPEPPRVTPGAHGCGGCGSAGGAEGLLLFAAAALSASAARRRKRGATR